MARAPRRHLAKRYGYVRFSALLLALFALIGVGQVLPALHFMLVAHRVCAEHGETLHASDASEAVDFAGVTGGEAELLLKPSPESEHEHEHCSVLGVGRSAHALLRAGGSRLGSLGAEERLDVAGERAAHVDIALLLYAPKLAPPG